MVIHVGTYITVHSLITMFFSVIDFLDRLINNRTNFEQRSEVSNYLASMLSFHFLFSLNLRSSLLGIINELSRALQQKHQDI